MTPTGWTLRARCRDWRGMRKTPARSCADMRSVLREYDEHRCRKAAILAVCSWQTTRPECRQSVGGRAYADQHTLDPTTSRQLLPPFAREMTCQVYDSALGAWGCLIPAFESTLPGRLSPPFTPLSSKSSLTSLPARFMIVPFDFGLPGCAHALYGGSIRRATPRAGSPRPSSRRRRVFPLSRNRDASSWSLMCQGEA